MGDRGNTEENIAPPKPTLLRRLYGFSVMAVLFGGVALMFTTSPTCRGCSTYYLSDDYRIFGLDRNDLFYIGVSPFIIVLVFTYVRRKFIPLAPEQQRRIDEAVARMRNSPRQRSRLQFMKILVPMLLLSLPVLWLMQDMASSVPQLAQMSETDKERIGLGIGLVLVLAGYGLYRLFVSFNRRAQAQPSAPEASIIPPRENVESYSAPRTDPAKQDMWKRPGS